MHRFAFPALLAIEFRTNLMAQIQINPYLNLHSSFGHNYSSRNSLLAQLGLSVHFSRINWKLRHVSCQ